MKGHLNGTRSYVAACRLAALGCFVGLGLTSQVHAGVATASITGFVKNPTKIGGNYIRQDHVLITLEQQLAKAETTYVSSAMGKSLVGQAVLEIAPAVAGPIIARTCFSPGGAVLCAGVGVAGWLALSRLYNKDDEWVQEEDQWGPCYTHRNGVNGGTDYAECRSSATEAVNAHVSLLNAQQQPWSDAINNYSRHWTGNVRNMCTPALNSSCSPYFTYVDTICPKQGGAECRENTGEDQETIYRRPDQLTIIDTPATESDFLTHGNNYPPDEPALNDYKGTIPVEAVKLQDSVAGIGDTYSPDDSPNEGPWVQDRVRASPNPETPDDTDLTTTTETVPVDNPNTPEVEGPVDGNDPDPDPPTDPGTEEPPPFDLCEEHPNIVACQDFGEVPDDQVPQTEYDMAWNAEPLGLPATCPAPLSMGSHGEFEFTPICDAAVAVSPLIVACGAICAAGIMLAAIRGS